MLKKTKQWKSYLKKIKNQKLPIMWRSRYVVKGRGVHGGGGGGFLSLH